MSYTLNYPGSASVTLGGLSSTDEIKHLTGRGITIRIIPATGGTVVMIKDESQIVNDSELYVIGQEDDLDLAQEIGKVLTLHLLKKDSK